mmetsp:Transcript_19018/g.67154  ORF Transcript_19018/g.67154 Transcript_19018/m.67154 type:complete len:392 (+) Transcript_19018:1219-2394(+)
MKKLALRSNMGAVLPERLPTAVRSTGDVDNLQPRVGVLPAQCAAVDTEVVRLEDLQCAVLGGGAVVAIKAHLLDDRVAHNEHVTVRVEAVARALSSVVERHAHGLRVLVDHNQALRRLPRAQARSKHLEQHPLARVRTLGELAQLHERGRRSRVVRRRCFALSLLGLATSATSTASVRRRTAVGGRRLRLGKTLAHFRARHALDKRGDLLRLDAPLTLHHGADARHVALDAVHLVRRRQAGIDGERGLKGSDGLRVLLLELVDHAAVEVQVGVAAHARLVGVCIRLHGLRQVCRVVRMAEKLREVRVAKHVPRLVVPDIERDSLLGLGNALRDVRDALRRRVADLAQHHGQHAQTSRRALLGECAVEAVARPNIVLLLPEAVPQAVPRVDV